MELIVGITIRQLLLLHLHYASEYKVPGYTSTSPGKSFIAVLNYKLRTRLWLVGHKVLLCCQVTVAVGVGVWIRATISQVGEQVPLVIVGTESSLFLLHCIHLKKKILQCSIIHN